MSKSLSSAFEHSPTDYKSSFIVLFKLHKEQRVSGL